ncbi:hypothetical protein BJX61DRAFT_39623 [Aspergillus egyptiacus]|nr:hypothetical protein BJX61DRAFT_39623 [Aspergillus egyptiacus]
MPSKSNRWPKPRGRYARWICRGCRSRKIKCNLPDLHEQDFVPGALLQSPEKSCGRCRTLGLECIIERTTMGRPALKREKPPSQTPCNAPVTSAEIKDYLVSEPNNDHGTTGESQSLEEEKLFRSTVEYQYFFASVLAKDRAFGAGIPRSIDPWTTPLVDLVDLDMAMALDPHLTWHKFFLPKLPSLPSIRTRLQLFDKDNTATNLLFALLSLIALDTRDTLTKRHPTLRRNLQLALSSYSQEFIFAPPTHHDSITVCLLLADYKPTAAAASQHVAHKSIKSTLYLGIASKVSQRMEILPAQLTLDFFPDQSTPENTAECEVELERQITDSLQGVKVLSQDIVVDGLLSEPVHAFQGVLESLAPHITAYHKLLQQRRCSVRLIFQMQWATAGYVLLDALKTMKHSWEDAERLYHAVEDIEEKCLAQIEFTHWILEAHANGDTTTTGSPEEGENEKEIEAARCILEQRFHAIIGRMYGLALLYISVMKSRHAPGNIPPSGNGNGNSSGSNSSTTTSPSTPSSGTDRDPEIHAHETIRLGPDVSDALRNAPDETSELVVMFLTRFGKGHTEKALSILEMFVKCTDMTLTGGSSGNGTCNTVQIPFQPPFRDIVLDILIFSKCIVENNNIHVRHLDGKMKDNAEYQMQVMGLVAERLESVAVGAAAGSGSSSKSVQGAFAGGCVYAASVKVMHGLLGFMAELKRRTSSAGNAGQEALFVVPGSTEGLAEGWNLWPGDDAGGSGAGDAGMFMVDWTGLDLGIDLGLGWAQ